ncbi:AAA family ATPase [Candidatus Falkowbacteria bacterium]|nr:AAA family ATPase [Candidatus Falkowbacteria bacterium]
MSEETQKPKSPAFVCPTCSGRGKAGVRSCSRCDGNGLYFWSNGLLYYWAKEINSTEIWQSRINRFLKVSFFILLGIFSFLGLFSLITFTLELIQSGTLWFGLTSIKDTRFFIFWLSVWVDLYFYYRFYKKPSAREQIILPENISKKSQNPPASWEEISSFPKKNSVDISLAFSIESLNLISQAWRIAKKLKHREVEPLHLLQVSLTHKKTAVVFGRLGLSLAAIQSKINSAFLNFFSDKNSIIPPRLSLNLKKTFFKAYLVAQAKRKNSASKTQVQLFDLLIAINNSSSPAREVLYALDVEKDELKNVVLWVETANELSQTRQKFSFLSRFKPTSSMNRAMTATATPILNRFARDFTLLARNGYLTPCVGRDDELAQIFKNAQTKKGGVLLIGNPGTGRTTIVGGVARRMVTEKVPRILQDKRLVSLSLAALVSGAGTGAAEQRVSSCLSEIIKSGNIALFIADVHNLIGVQTVSGELDASEILASAVTGTRFFVIATTTPVDYHRYIEGTALDDALEKIKISEPKDNQAIQILEVKSLSLEAKHEVFFSYDSIATAVKLSDRYLHDRYLPEKGINLLEDAAFSVRSTRGKNTIIQKEDIARAVSQKTKIPLTKITEQESQKLLHLEEKIHEKMIDQEPAVQAVSNALRRARAQLRDAGRPIANFLFLGPTGVGKTQLAKVVAETYFGSVKNMIRLDMSEYQEQESISRLIGSAKSKISGHLTEAARRNPFSLILLDELEKAHPEILNLFLQVMDEGRLTDGSGRVIDFTNSIIIATSNAGAQYIQDAIRKNEPYENIKRHLIENELKNSYRPEFLNRLDEVIVFKPLSQSEINQIACLLLAEVVRQMETKGIKLEVTEPAVIELAQAGFDPEFGARPLRRVIQERVSNALATAIIQGELSRRDTVIYDMGGKISVKKARHL